MPLSAGAGTAQTLEGAWAAARTWKGPGGSVTRYASEESKAQSDKAPGSLRATCITGTVPSNYTAPGTGLLLAHFTDEESEPLQG